MCTPKNSRPSNWSSVKLYKKERWCRSLINYLCYLQHWHRLFLTQSHKGLVFEIAGGYNYKGQLSKTFRSYLFQRFQMLGLILLNKWSWSAIRWKMWKLYNLSESPNSRGISKRIEALPLNPQEWSVRTSRIRYHIKLLRLKSQKKTG